MNTVTASEHRALELVDIIDFKWLMANEGHRVHVERLQQDPSYAAECIARAGCSPSEALRRAGARLEVLLALPRP